MGLREVACSFLSGSELLAAALVTVTCWRFLVGLLAVAALATRFRRKGCAWTEGAGAGGIQLGDDVDALQVLALADEDTVREVHFTFLSFVCFSSGFFSRKRT